MCYAEACSSELQAAADSLDAPSAELVRRQHAARGEDGLSDAGVADGGAQLVIKERKFEVVSMCTMFFGYAPPNIGRAHV